MLQRKFGYDRYEKGNFSEAYSLFKKITLSMVPYASTMLEKFDTGKAFFPDASSEEICERFSDPIELLPIVKNGDENAFLVYATMLIRKFSLVQSICKSDALDNKDK
eukprot:Pgem_evm1s2110